MPAEASCPPKSAIAEKNCINSQECAFILRAIANRNNDLQSAALDGGAAHSAAERSGYTPPAKATMWHWRLLCNRGQYIVYTI